MSPSEQQPFAPSDLPIGPDGRIYHLQVKPEEVAPNILIVGDPGRARFIAEKYFDEIEATSDHRGLVTITGSAKIPKNEQSKLTSLRTSVVTSGMGTPSFEIVANEIVTLHEIDFATRTCKEKFPRIHIIRVGTSGGLQAQTELGTPIITTYGIGMDNAGCFYEAPYPDETCRRLELESAALIRENMPSDSRFYGRIQPYVSRANPAMVEALKQASSQLGVPTKPGLTVSAPGFSAAQGRDINRVKPSVMDLDLLFSEFNPGVEGQLVENMEMEASFLLHYMNGLGHWAGAICVAIANRRQNTIDVNYQESIANATQVALLALALARSENSAA